MYSLLMKSVYSLSNSGTYKSRFPAVVKECSCCINEINTVGLISDTSYSKLHFKSYLLKL